MRVLVGESEGQPMTFPCSFVPYRTDPLLKNPVEGQGYVNYIIPR